MTKTQQLQQWKHLTELLRAARHGHSIDQHKAAELADTLAPHSPGFSFTLKRISNHMRG